MNNSDICPICHQASLYAECSLGEWEIGCDVCNISTGICDSYEDAEEEWEKMMNDRISFITKIE